ncbi:MAG: tyrosine-type recombinase/integrase [Planctomycetaceae bacterium]|nr:tyrosine-type recombinase/integrase [Planctomycetaceae bacterium]
MVRRRRKGQRTRIGQVSYYPHHGAWYIYYRDGRTPVRRRVADTEDEAAAIAAQINGQLATSGRTPFSFTPLSVAELRRRFLDYHEQVSRSALATIRRYRTATLHLENFARETGQLERAHEIDAEQFTAWLRQQHVSPNGHPNTARRPLRDKGLRYVLEVCRSLYAYAARQRHLPPYADNPFSSLRIERMRVEDARPVFVFDAGSELRFLQQADPWSFTIQFTLAKTGLRPGELAHLLIEDLDLEDGWLRVSNKAELGWRIKTGRERSVPLIGELVDVLQQTVGTRTAGPVFLRHQFVPGNSQLTDFSRTALQHALNQRISGAERDSGGPLSREIQARLARSVWRDAGAVRSDRIRTTFIRTAKAAGLPAATCPKSWRHTFATLLQDASVDPLIRQVTLGHRPTDDARGGLGMTGVYTHTRAETQKREIERALRLWPDSLTYARQRAEMLREQH